MDLEIFDQTTAQLPNEQLEMVRDLLQYAAKELSLSENTEMSLTFVNNPEIKKLNAQYRNVDRATDVLSFAAEEAGDETPMAPGPIRAGSRKVRLSENRNTTHSAQMASLRWWSRSNSSGEKNWSTHPAWGIMAIRAQKETEAPICPR